MPSTASKSTAGFVLNKAARSYVITRLEQATDLCGYERDLLEALKNSKCQKCRGTGYAPYVGGDDEASCQNCDGTGFDPDANPSEILK